jgi:predicted Zn-dependent protease with MMP-like domain
MISTRDRQVFDEVLDQTIAGLPPRLHELLEEVPLIVEDEPGEALLADVLGESGGGDLCGLHWGTPLTERSVEASAGFPGVPDRMMLFRGPIMRLAGYHGTAPGAQGRRGRGLVELRRQVKITLLHEIGHHFGLDEDDLTGLGYG